MPSSNLKNSVKNTIERYSMINKGDTVIAAVSGGADSVALLYVLYSLKDELGFSLAACHVNHNLRGEESDSDERFVRRMCRFLDIPLYTASIKVNDLRQKHDSLEECARRLRYEFFESISKDRLIATAHTASDNCETILINMVRGTALSGICGIPAKRDNIIRPLLYNTREDIELYCSENCLDYVTDSTNLSDDYTRNRIRHKVVPLLKEINPSLFSAISRLSQSVSDDDRYLDKIASELMEKARTADDKYDYLFFGHSLHQQFFHGLDMIPKFIVEILALVREKDLLQSGIRRNGDPDDIALLLHQLEDSGHGRTGDVEITFQIPLADLLPLMIVEITDHPGLHRADVTHISLTFLFINLSSDHIAEDVDFMTHFSSISPHEITLLFFFVRLQTILLPN